MTVNSISTDNSWLSQLNQQSIANPTAKPGGVQSGGISQTNGTGFLNSIVQALSDIGVGSGASSSTNSDSSSSSSSQDPAQALASFIQSLMAALHAQNGSASGTRGGTDSDGDNDGSGTANLTDFLQAFSSNLNNTTPNGNVLSTQA